MRILMVVMMSGVALSASGCGRAPRAGPTTAPAATMGGGGASTERAATRSVATQARIVSLVPAATEILRQMGALDCVVGVTKYDIPALPEKYQHLPVVGDYESINYERIVELHPTAIVVQMEPTRVPERLKELCAAGHVTLINLKMDRLRDLDVAEQQLQAAAGGEQSNKPAEIVAKHVAGIAGAQPPRVVYLASDVGMMIAGGKNFLDDEIHAAGGKNVGAACGDGYPVISREKLIGLAPDVLLIAAPGAPDQQGPHDPRLAQWNALPIPAAADQRIFLMTDPDTEMLTLDAWDQIMLLTKLFSPAPNAAAGTRP